MAVTKKKPQTYQDDPVQYSAGQYNAVSPSLVDGDCVTFQFDSAGNLLTKQVNAGSGSNPAAGATGSAVPADGDFGAVNVGGTLAGVTGKSLAAGAVIAPTIAIVDGSGNQVTAFGGSASAIASNYHAVSAGNNNAANIKNAAGTLFAVRVYNAASYPVYVKLYNKASAPTVGTDTPFKTIGVQAGTQRDVAISGGGLTMGTGIGIGIVKGIADNDNTAVLASDCVVDVEYS